MKPTLRAAVLLAVCVSTIGSPAEASFDSAKLGADAPSVLWVTFDTGF
jgi:hypothetical protein